MFQMEAADIIETYILSCTMAVFTDRSSLTWASCKVGYILEP